MIGNIRKRFVNRQGIMSLLVGAMGLGMLGIFLGVFSLVIVKINETVDNGKAEGLLTTTITALAEYTNWMQLIALVASAAALLMILMGVFIRIRGGMSMMGEGGVGGV